MRPGADQVTAFATSEAGPVQNPARRDGGARCIVSSRQQPRVKLPVGRCWPLRAVVRGGLRRFIIGAACRRGMMHASVSEVAPSARAEATTKTSAQNMRTHLMVHFLADSSSHDSFLRPCASHQRVELVVHLVAWSSWRSDGRPMSVGQRPACALHPQAPALAAHHSCAAPPVRALCTLFASPPGSLVVVFDPIRCRDTPAEKGRFSTACRTPNPNSRCP